MRISRLLRIALLRIGGLLRIYAKSGRRCSLSHKSLLRLFLIGCNSEALDRSEDSAVVLSAVDAGIDGDTLTRQEVV